MDIGYLICADWGKEVAKRRCCVVDVKQRQFEILDEPELTFEKLLKLGLSYGKASGTLLSLDLAIGVPAQFMKLVNAPEATRDQDFLEWLSAKRLDSDFWEETRVADEWSAEAPFVSVPGGKGSLGKFYDVAGHDLRRRTDKVYGGKSPFIVNGIPGTVGSGTRSFWRELLPHLQGKREFGLWPFDGELETLFQSYGLVVAENYPAVSYTSVFADVLPSPQLLLSKTRRNVREAAINELGNLSWIKDAEICLPDLEVFINFEDEFDALMAALSQFRLLTAELGMADEAFADASAEGGILGTNVIQIGKKKYLDAILGGKPPRKKGRHKGAIAKVELHQCRLCDHVFKQARNGWRSHVGSMKRHPDWHPKVTDKKLRQDLFEEEFPDFFA